MQVIFRFQTKEWFSTKRNELKVVELNLESRIIHQSLRLFRVLRWNFDYF
jgi:hypothetical protein